MHLTPGSALPITHTDTTAHGAARPCPPHSPHSPGPAGSTAGPQPAPQRGKSRRTCPDAPAGSTPRGRHPPAHRPPWPPSATHARGTEPRDPAPHRGARADAGGPGALRPRGRLLTSRAHGPHGLPLRNGSAAASGRPRRSPGVAAGRQRGPGALRRRDPRETKFRGSRGRDLPRSTLPPQGYGGRAAPAVP